MSEARDRAAEQPASRPYPPPVIDRVRVLIRVQRAYDELLAATAELAAIDRAIIKAGGMPRATMIPAQVEAVLRPHLDRIMGKIR